MGAILTSKFIPAENVSRCQRAPGEPDFKCPRSQTQGTLLKREPRPTVFKVIYALTSRDITYAFNLSSSSSNINS